MKLELVLLAGADTKVFLGELASQITRLEKTLAKMDALGVAPKDAEEEDKEDDDDADFTPKKKAPKKKTFEDDEEDEDTEEDSEEEETPAPKKKGKAKAPVEDDEEDVDTEEEEEPAPKKGKAKKLTSDDCNDAAKALAKAIGGKPGREAVLKVMKKQFRTESVSELKPEQYADFIAAMDETRAEHEE